MYKLIIVDDEKVIRKGMSDYFDWQSMNFEVSALFEDGKEALAYLETEHVDVVLTDIEMAEVSGLDLAKYIYENKMPQRVVIISGYKEFEYARKAVQYGVEHYLLKPVKMEEVIEVFTRISRELDETSNQQNTELTEMLPELIEQFWISMLVGGARSAESIRKRCKMLNMPIDEEMQCALLYLSIPEKDENFLEHFEGENYRYLIYNVCGRETEGFYYYPVCLSDDFVKVIVVNTRSDQRENFESELLRQIEEKCETVMALLKIKVELKIEKILSNILELTEYQCVFPRKKDNSVETTLNPEDFERFQQKYKLIMSTINDGDFEELDYLIDVIFHDFRNKSDNKIKDLCVDMFSMLSGRLMKMGIDGWPVGNEKLGYQELLETEQPGELKQLTKERLHMMLKLVREKQNSGSRYFVEDSIQYIKKHYAEDISLERVASRFFLNQAYFSRLFKQYTGTTFTDYLIQLRMDKAKELLRCGTYKVYEVSELVGYRSEKYFYRIFKQYAGCSPSEYYRGKYHNED